MKKLLILILMLLISASVFSSGSSSKDLVPYGTYKFAVLDSEGEVIEPANLCPLFVALHGSPNESHKLLGESFAETHPVSITWLPLANTTGGMDAVNAYRAAGIKFIICDYGGRLGELMVEEYAQDLSTYVNDYLPGALDPVTRGSSVYAFPLAGTSQNFIVNMDIMDEIGYEVPPNWTTDDFLDMCALAKEKGYIALDYFVGTKNADYYFMHIFSWFGVEVYSEDYSRCTFDNKQSIRALYYLKNLYDSGYLPSDVISRGPGEYFQTAYGGKSASYASFVGFTPGNIDSYYEQDRLEKPWTWKVVPFPTYDVSYSPKYFNMQHGIVVPNFSNDPQKSELNLLFAKDYRDWTQNNNSKGALMPVRLNESYTAETAPDYDSYKPIYESSSPWDLGLFTKTYAAVRFEMAPLLQALFLDELTPEEVASEYEDKVNEILRQSRE